MTSEQGILLSILSSAVNSKEINVDNDVDFFAIKFTAFEQGIGGLVFSEIQRQYTVSKFATLSSQLKLEWYALLQQIEKRNIEVNKVVYKVVKCLNDKNIASLLLKGQALAQFYPSPLARTSGDIDLYVGTSNYDDAKKVFREAGLLIGNGNHEDFKHLAFTVDTVSIELHRYGELLPNSARNEYLKKEFVSALQFSDGGFFLDAEGSTDRDYLKNSLFVKSLPDGLNVVYTFIHMFRHFIGGGISLRQVMDYAVLLKSQPEKSEKIESHLEMTGFIKPWQVFGCLLVKYIGFKPEEIPCYDARYEKKADRVMTIILEEGHNKQLKKKGKWSEYWRECKAHFRLFGLFPAECLGFLTRLLKNTVLKYAKI